MSSHNKLIAMRVCVDLSYWVLNSRARKEFPFAISGKGVDLQELSN